MPATLKAMREERAKVWEEAKKFNDAVPATRSMTAEETAKWKTFSDDLDAREAAIGRAERLDEIEAGARRSKDALPGRDDTDPSDPNDAGSRKKPGAKPKVNPEDFAQGFRAWARSTSRRKYEVTEEDVEVAKRVGLSLGSDEVEVGLRRGLFTTSRAEMRALSAINLAAGAATIPEGFMASLERALLFFGGMRQVASVIRTASGNQMPWPTVNDTSNEGVEAAENVAQTDQDVTFGQIVFNAYKYSSKFVKVPAELLEDSAFDIGAVVGSLIGERLARIQNRRFTTGSGVGQPTGIVNAATVATLSTGVATTAAAAAIAADEIIDLVHTVDPAYRAQGASFMFADTTLRDIRKLKDGQGHYLWQPNGGGEAGLADGIGPTLYGHPYTINNHMAAIAASAKTVLFGMLSKYQIRDVASLRLLRLRERFADADQEAFIGFMRCDGNLLDAGTHPVKVLVQHA